MGFARLFLLICFMMACTVGYSQSHNASAYEHLASGELQREHILNLTGGETSGRATGSRGAYVAKQYIEERFEEYGIASRGILYYQPFRENSVTGYNVIGEVRASERSNEYVIVGAHYDHLGTIKGKTYPGADDNASGVAALLELGRMFAQMKKDTLCGLRREGDEHGRKQELFEVVKNPSGKYNLHDKYRSDRLNSGSSGQRYELSAGAGS